MSRDMIAFAAWASSQADDVKDPLVVQRAYEAVFQTEYGRTVLIDLFMRHNVMTPSYVPGASFPETAFFDGMKQVVSEIITKALHGEALRAYLTPSPEGNPHDRSSPIID